MKIEDPNSILAKANYIDYEVYCRIRKLAHYAAMTEYTAEIEECHGVVGASYRIKVSANRTIDSSIPISTLDGSWIGKVTGTKFGSVILNALHDTRYMADHRKELENMRPMVAALMREHAGSIDNIICVNAKGGSSIWYRTMVSNTPATNTWTDVEYPEYTATENVSFTYNELMWNDMFGTTHVDIPPLPPNPDVYHSILLEMGAIYTEVMNGAIGMPSDGKEVYDAIGRLDQLRRKL
jgi:hypothetical protein